MKSGLLWFDNSTNFIEKKIEAAAQRYQDKFGIAPTIAFVNPKMLENKPTPRIKNIRVESKSTILPNHIWIGKS